tara:strand:- start:54 stop:494 length:441 start_codon:yes stop_codon:yes gene_type:complete
MIDKKLFDSLKKLLPNGKFPAPFVTKFNLKITKFKRGYSEASVIVPSDCTNPFGIVHGGFLFTLLDEILGSACCSMLTDKIYSNMKAMSTTNHDIFFHSPALVNDNLIISANVISARKNMIFVEGNIKRFDGALIAQSKGIWFIKR